MSSIRRLTAACARVAPVILAAALLTPSATAGEVFDLSDPEQALKADQKVGCSLVDGKPAVYWWAGSMYSRVPGEKDRLLFKVEGMNVRACKALHDEKRGYGYRSVSREVMFYLDPKTNEVLRKWQNPWTGEEVDVVHVANDPVNMRKPRYAYDEEGKPHKSRGFVKDGTVYSGGGAARLFYKNGLRLASWDDLPEVVKTEIKQNYPAYVEPPPLDDKRPNETSWTVFKAFADEKRAAEGKPKSEE